MNSWPAALLALARGRPEMLPMEPERPRPSLLMVLKVIHAHSVLLVRSGKKSAGSIDNPSRTSASWCGPLATRPPPSRGPSVRLLAQAKNRKATTWNHITHPWFVDWHVRAGDWPLSMPSDYGSAAVKGSIYSTVMINHHKCNNDKCWNHRSKLTETVQNWGVAHGTK